MNNGVANEATRCFRRLFDAFQHKVRAANPGLEINLRHVQPRNLGELPDRNTDLVLSSGGPGSPYDGYDDPWCVGFRKFIDHVVERNLAAPDTAPGMLVVCHSFEIAVTHFAVATMVPRSSRKFGVMPCYVTEEGRRSVLFASFGDRLFTWEHRNWEPVDLDEHKLRKLGGALLAKESREGRFDKGRALLGFDFARGISGTQFHPEADRPGVLAWINRPEHAADVKGAYGVDLYERMIKTLSDPTRLARTYALLIPGWLAHRFNQLAEVRGLRPIAGPEEDAKEFETDGSPDVPRAVGAATG
jgi:GMP synthase-like glutamine amidotransferase